MLSKPLQCFQRYLLAFFCRSSFSSATQWRQYWLQSDFWHNVLNAGGVLQQKPVISPDSSSWFVQASTQLVLLQSFLKDLDAFEWYRLYFLMLLWFLTPLSKNKWSSNFPSFLLLIFNNFQLITYKFLSDENGLNFDWNIWFVFAARFSWI